MAELADATDLKSPATYVGNHQRRHSRIGRPPAPPSRPFSRIPPRAWVGHAALTFAKDPPPPYDPRSTVVAERAWRNGRRSGLEENLSARRETGGAELPKFGEPFHMAIPSQARPQPGREGVETRRAAPKAHAKVKV